MKHPFRSVLPGLRAYVFVPLVCLTAAAWAGREFVNRPLETALTPGGLSAIALSSDPQTVGIILRNWTQAGLLPQAFFALGLQFVWVLLVSTTLSFACVWASSQLSAKHWVAAGIALAWAQWVGALYGVAGDILTGFLLGGRVASPLPDWTFLCTIGEMLTFLVGALYATAGFVMRELPRSSRAGYLLR